MDTENVLLVEKKDGIATLTLNRPDRKNAMSGALLLALSKAFQDLNQDKETHVVILTGAGAAFCAGLDLRELSEGAELSRLLSDEKGAARLPDLMAGMAQPIIGAINGPAVTGGFELALACDILIASTSARFADTHARVGILPGWGLSQVLPRIIGPGRAKELSFSGNFLSADKALAWGLVNRVVSPEALLPEALALAQDIRSSLPFAVTAYKNLINKGLAMNLDDALKMELDVSKASARRATSEQLSERREKIICRGQDQQRKKS